MEIRTKFNLGDTVFFLGENSIKFSRVKGIETKNILHILLTKENSLKNIENHSVVYIIEEKNTRLPEEAVFATRNELLEHLKNS